MKTQLSPTQIQSLILKLQSNKLTSRDERDLYTEIEMHFKPHYIDNYLYDQEEIKSEFMIAAWNALFRAKVGIGNPILYAVRRGYGATLDYYRRTSSQNLLKVCKKCGEVYIYDHRRKKCTIKGCNCQEFSSIEKTEYFSKTKTGFSKNTDFESYVDSLEFNDMVIGLIQGSNIPSIYKKAIIEAITLNQDIHEYVSVCFDVSIANNLLIDLREVLSKQYKF